MRTLIDEGALIPLLFFIIAIVGIAYTIFKPSTGYMECVEYEQKPVEKCYTYHFFGYHTTCDTEIEETCAKYEWRDK